MVRGVFVHVRKAQQQLQHAVALFRLGIAGAFFQIIDDRQSVIGSKRSSRLRVDGVPFAASLHGFASAAESLIEKMPEAHFFARETRRNQIASRDYGGKVQQSTAIMAIELLRTNA